MAGVSLHETGYESMVKMINRLCPLKTVWNRSFVQKVLVPGPKAVPLIHHHWPMTWLLSLFGAITCSLDAHEFGCMCHITSL